MGLFPVLVALGYILVSVASQNQPSCASKVFCQGDLLHTVQMARLFDDSKTFVDMKLKQDETTTLRNFEQFMNSTNNNPTKEEVKEFLDANFEQGSEFDDWVPSDYTESPKFLARVSDPSVKNFAQEMVKKWKLLARKMKQEVLNTPELYTLIPVEHGFVIPGGRFREFYYWDSYWIIRGLLLSEMHDTVRGMLDNFLSLVDRYGFVPNGARIYYLNRSQPPLLTMMVAAYIQETNDTAWLATNVPTIDKELRFWLDNRVVDVTIEKTVYQLARYDSESGSPRPESYWEDIRTASFYTDEERRIQMYADLKSGAESGYDFSSRWIIDEFGGNNGNITLLATRKIIPVDLNAFLCHSFQKLSEFYVILQDFDNARFWYEKANKWKTAIKEVHYNEVDGIWYDWNLESGQHRRYFFPTNFAPLWTQAYDLSQAEVLGRRAAEYIVDEGILDFPGGIPASLSSTGEQWDYPAAWAPSQHIVVFGLDNSGNCNAKNISRELGERWVNANMIGFNKTGSMYEKYNAEVPGQYGGGGEYNVQEGFGWTNGEALVLIDRFYTDKYAKES